MQVCSTAYSCAYVVRQPRTTCAQLPYLQLSWLTCNKNCRYIKASCISLLRQLRHQQVTCKLADL